MYTVEFQNRGLPHAHILIFLYPDNKNPSVSKIDTLVSIEIPDKNIDTLRFAAVENYMMHTPYGDLN